MSVCFTLCTIVGFGEETTKKQDKNGVSTNVISLPSPPGSIKGLGEAFKPMLNTGTAKYTVSIDVPPGANGHTPQLALTYDSGRGSGPCGIGWAIGPGPIRRQTNKGCPLYVDGPNGRDDDYDSVYDEPDEIDTILGPDGEELVELTGGILRAKIETAFARFRRKAPGWHVDLRDGTRLAYGRSPASQITDSTGKRIYRWLLEKSTDANGNTIIYTYYNSGDPGFAESENQKYLKEIRYGPGSGPWQAFYYITFDYEARDDGFNDCRPGFPIYTAHRLKSITIGIQGINRVYPDCAIGDFNGDGDNQDLLIRRYDLFYEEGLSCSRLTGIVQVGSDGHSSLPALTFTYSTEQPGEGLSARDAIYDSENVPYMVMDSDLAEFVDLNADSLPDILLTDFMGGRHTVFQNQGVHPGERRIRWAPGAGITARDGFSSALDLSNRAVHLADMDGDGKADLVHTTPWKSVTYHSNTGKNTWGRRQRMSIRNTAPPAPFSDNDVRISDVDGDRCIDVFKSTSTGYSIWFNRGQGVYSRQVRTDGAVYNGRVIRFSDRGVHLADLNGDELNDVVRITSTHLIYCAHLGHGSFAPAQTVRIPGHHLDDMRNEQIKRAVLEDVNGDGLADLIVERATINTLWLWLNRGERRNQYAQPDGHGVVLTGPITITDMPAVYHAKTTVRWADLNGNGTKDLVYACSALEPRLRCFDLGELIRGSIPANMLIAVDNGLGLTTRIQYTASTVKYVEKQRSSRPWNTTLPITVYVVSGSEVDVATVSGIDTYYTDYDYWSGYYDWAEKEFRGFAREETIQFGDASTPDVHATSEFHTGDPTKSEHECLKGKLKALEIRGVQDANDTLYTRQENTWKSVILKQGIDQREVAFAYKTQTLKKIYEGLDTPEYLLTQYVVDPDYGHVLEERNYGVVGDPDKRSTYDEANDEILTCRRYRPNRDKWILDLKTLEDVNDFKGRKQASSTYAYDDNGNLTCQKAWLGPDDVWIPVLRNQYDEYGNIARITNANDHHRTIAYDDILQTYPIAETVHLDPLADPCALSLTVDYHFSFGQICRATDFSAAVSTFDYDCFGRLQQILRPGQAWERFEYKLASPVSHILSQKREHRDCNDSSFDTYTFFDGLGRKLGSKLEATPDPESKGTRWRYVDAVAFNQRGQERYRYLPYFSHTAAYEPPDKTELRVSLKYDGLDRVIRTENPDGTYSTVKHEPLVQHLWDENDHNDVKFGYDPTYKTLTYDGQERLIEVIERNREHNDIHRKTNMANSYFTSYVWSTLGDLTQIIDGNNNVKHLKYDSLRRKVEMNDPDRGRMLYAYDPAGNLIKTKDAKGQVVKYTYDAAGRLLSENYLDDPNAVSDPCDVIYHYDVPALIELPDGSLIETTHVKGRLSWVQDLTGQETFSYDARGNTNYTSKLIHDPNGFTVRGNPLAGYRVAHAPQKASSPRVFTIGYDYDPMDRIVQVTYPDTNFTQALYRYGIDSMLQSISVGQMAVIADANYTAASQPRGILYGNQVKTSYVYDDRHRLASLTTLFDPNYLINSAYDNRHAFVPSPVLTDPNILINYAYEYDPVSNITRITDLRAFGTGLAASSLRRNTQRFQYDDLYRLKQVRYPRRKSGQASYDEINYLYDRIGNMLYKASPHGEGHINDAQRVNLYQMSYGGEEADGGGRSNRDPNDPDLPHQPGPHALTMTQAPNGKYYYDRNGNMTDFEGAECLWDYQDRLIRHKKNGLTAIYAYDYTGRRIIKQMKDGNETTLYPDRLYEIRPEDERILYVFNDDTRVAQMTNDPNGQTHWLYYHGDHLGSSNVVTDGQGQLVKEMTYYPFGTLRTEYPLGAAKTHYGFTGKEEDLESGLQYFEARYYLAHIGNFISVDPLFSEELMPNASRQGRFADLLIPLRYNLYSYARRQPIRYSDPSGEQDENMCVENPSVENIMNEVLEEKKLLAEKADEFYSKKNLQRGYQLKRYSGMHKGGDFGVKPGSDLDIGSDVPAPTDGVILKEPGGGVRSEMSDMHFAKGDKRALGNRVRIKTDDGRILEIGHLQMGSNRHLEPGQRIWKGESVGRIGTSGNAARRRTSTPPHTHIKVKKNGQVVPDARLAPTQPNWLKGAN